MMITICRHSQLHVAVWYFDRLKITPDDITQNSAHLFTEACFSGDMLVAKLLDSKAKLSDYYYDGFLSACSGGRIQTAQWLSEDISWRYVNYRKDIRVAFQIHCDYRKDIRVAFQIHCEHSSTEIVKLIAKTFNITPEELFGIAQYMLPVITLYGKFETAKWLINQLRPGLNESIRSH